MLHNYRNRKERYVIKSFLSLSLILVSSIYSQETHVFWYKALQNNYTLIDSPGPNLPANSIVHEGKIVTCAHAPGLGWSYSGFSCGSSIDDDQGYCSFLYSVNLNDAALIGRVDSAFIRGEYKVANSASSGPLNHGGPINIRCGVADVTYGVDSIWQGGGGLLDDAIYTDLAPYSVLDYSLPLVDSTIDTIAFIAETERSSFVDPPVLDSHFFKIDVTKQVQWIVQHHDGKYGIAVLSPLGQGSTGKFTLWADETCNLDISSYIDRWTPPPWTKDGNTTHLLVYGDLTDSVHMERPSLIVRQTYAVSISPNPFNPSTTISFSVPGNGQAELDIFSATGKLISKKQVTGNGSYTWDASAQASGIYVCRLDVGGKAIARRMILIR